MNRKVFSVAVLVVFIVLAIVGPLAQTGPTWAKAAIEPEHGDPKVQLYGTSIFSDFRRYATPSDYQNLLWAGALVGMGFILFRAIRNTNWT